MENDNASPENGKKSTTLAQKIGAGIVALITASSAPWWWDKIFPPEKSIAIHLQRVGVIDDCMRVPHSANIAAISSHDKRVGDFVLEPNGCDAKLQVPGRTSGSFTLKLTAADSIALDEPAKQYTFDKSKEDKKPLPVYVSEANIAHTQIIMLKYADCSDDNSHEDTLSAFRGGIRRRLHNLQQVIGEANSAEPSASHQAGTQPLGVLYDYLRSADVLSSSEEPGSLASIEARWRETKSLQVLSGQCTHTSDALRLHSEVFAGNFFPNHATGTFEIDSALHVGEFGDFRDLHLASILYTLAIEAKLRGKKDELERPLLIAALASANTKGTSVSDSQRIVMCEDILASLKQDFGKDTAQDACR
jgi:hypothetical protein